MGIHNSSLTRVQPVFDALYDSDRTGKSWLLPLLQLGSQSSPIMAHIDPGCLLRSPRYEFPAPPPRNFLRYLLENPSKLSVPPERTWRKWSPETQAKRRALLAGDRSVQEEAISELDRASDLNQRAWWRLEGTTSVDCALFTESLVLFIEGKRTEQGPSREVTWWAGRNQVIRNVECAKEFARATGRAHALVLLIVEEDLCSPGTERACSVDAIMNPQVIAASLPHLAPEIRDHTMTVYLGWTTWQAIVRRMALDSTVLVDIVNR